MKTSFDNETKTHGRTDGRTNKNKSSYRDHPLCGDLKTFSNNGPSYLLTYLIYSLTHLLTYLLSYLLVPPASGHLC